MRSSQMPAWQNSELDVRAEVLPKYFFTTVSIDVYLDGLCILRTEGVLKFSGTQTTAFKRADGNHLLELVWQSPGLGIDFSYGLSVDGQPVIERSRVRPRNWPFLFIPAIALAVALVIFHIVKNTL
jgi:hypothetical protein